MLQMRLLTFALFAIICFAACKHRKNEPPGSLGNDQVYPSYSHLVPGNYWVYQVFTLDSNGNNATATQVFDSMYVEKDTAIGTRTFRKLMEPQGPGSTNYTWQFLRDSLHYIIDERGTIFFSSLDFTTVFQNRYLLDPNHVIGSSDTVGRIEVKMADRDKSVTVPAGTFITSSWQSTWYMHPSYAVFGPTVRRLNTRYSINVGLVSETLPFYASIPGYQERRLVRYYLK